MSAGRLHCQQIVILRLLVLLLSDLSIILQARHVLHESSLVCEWVSAKRSAFRTGSTLAIRAVSRSINSMVEQIGNVERTIRPR